jgi:uncharacterized protein YbjQ (UPF0145 family)
VELRVVPGAEFGLRRPQRPGRGDAERPGREHGQKWAGYRITQVHGDVFGLTVRSRNYFSNLGAQLTSAVGGEVPGYTKLLTDSRNQARERMWREARTRGANAVVAMRFDCNELSGVMSEIAAYGTAVTVEPREGLGD